MAISIKSMNGLAALKKIGIPQDLYDWLKSKPVQVSLGATKFTFSIPAELVGEPVQHEVPVTLDQLQKLNAGTLPPTQKTALRHALGSTISGLIAAYGAKLEDKTAEKLTSAVEASMYTPGQWEQQLSALNKLPPIKSAPEKPKPQGLWPMFDLTQLKSAAPVKLRDASMMYQPVQGTSVGSRYFVVGANKDVRIAARFQNGKLSVRIEGPSWQNYTENIASCGFGNVDKAMDYASLHLDVGHDMVVASKTMGAILMGLGVPLETPLPEMKVIKS
ncbi:MAG: hypothetical protein KJZ83_00410 [Burkholderiaceae bacterium]|nr:hypothetical protein [Burkholderiaceae bacterium]